MLTAGLETEWS